MSLIGLTTLVTVNMMGSGIIMLPTSMAQLGAVSLLSWAVTAVGSMAIAYSFTQCGVFCTRPGGLSAYTEEAHAKSGFFLCSYLYLLSLAIANVAVAISAVGYMTAFFPWLGSSATALFVGTAGLIWMTILANFGGPDITGKIGSITVWGVIVPVAGLSVIGWAWFDSKILAQAWNPNDLPIWEAIGSLRLLEHIYEYAPVSMVLPRSDGNFRLLVDTVLSQMYRSGEIEQAYGTYLGGTTETIRTLFKLYALP